MFVQIVHWSETNSRVIWSALNFIRYKSNLAETKILNQTENLIFMKIDLVFFKLSFMFLSFWNKP